MNRSYATNGRLVTIDNVSLDYGEKPILRDLNVAVDDIVRPGCVTGQVIGILGPSGVGKTQFSRVLTGLQPPTRGNVTIHTTLPPGNDGKQETRDVIVSAGLVGYVPQNYPLLRHRTVLGNLVIAAKRNGASEADALARANEFLQRFDLLDRRDFYPSQLSGGQRQRIAIAQQLLCSEHFLVLDEPTTGLDPLMKNKVCDLITHVAQMSEENTIFIVTHDVPAVLSVADHLWILGRVRDADSKALGSSIVEKYDLIERGIAWDPGASARPGFNDLVREIHGRFATL